MLIALQVVRQLAVLKVLEVDLDVWAFGLFILLLLSVFDLDQNRLVVGCNQQWLNANHVLMHLLHFAKLLR